MLWARRYRAVVAFCVAMGLADLVTARVLKPAFERPRPCRTLEGLVPVVPCGPGQSMPSGHAAVAFAFLAAAASSVRRGWLWLTPPAAGVAASRVVLGVHYPSDVIVGAGVGLALGFMMRRLFASEAAVNPADMTGDASVRTSKRPLASDREDSTGEDHRAP